jgi:ATP-binding cassette subfamily A (ABC1) protein 3
MNGAGKSTTLAALSGDTVPTAGEIYLNNFNLMTDPGNALKYFGWCPQFDALIGNLTGREQLRMYCRIKGLREEVINDSVNAFLKMLDLEYLADRVVGGYSGGNKRKMSLAVAMIGNPPIVFLDEPSTGMDPLARRFMWNVITGLGSNKAVIVTTHSMEECDALTQRIGIMSQGRLVCLGSSQHLKSRFAAGYSLQVKAKPETLHLVRAEIMRVFPMAKLADAHGEMTAYELPQQAGYQLSTIFGLLQHMGAQGWTDDYAVSQTTLEQVFLKLAKEKAEGAAPQPDDETIVLTR